MKTKAPETPKICLIYRRIESRKEWGPCRRKATKHNGLAWYCDECYKEHYGKKPTIGQLHKQQNVKDKTQIKQKKIFVGDDDHDPDHKWEV